MCRGIVDDILEEFFDISLSNDPYTTYVEQWVVKPDVYRKKMVSGLESKFNRIDKKHEYNPGLEHMSNYEYQQSLLKYGHIPNRGVKMSEKIKTPADLNNKHIPNLNDPHP